LPEPEEGDIKKFDLEIIGNEYMDSEEVDIGEIG
jgi:hypothetical protein